jgi:hypothetical protein
MAVCRFITFPLIRRSFLPPFSESKLPKEKMYKLLRQVIVNPEFADRMWDAGILFEAREFFPTHLTYSLWYLLWTKWLWRRLCSQCLRFSLLKTFLLLLLTCLSPYYSPADETPYRILLSCSQGFIHLPLLLVGRRVAVNFEIDIGCWNGREWTNVKTTEFWDITSCILIDKL